MQDKQLIEKYSVIIAEFMGYIEFVNYSEKVVRLSPKHSYKKRMAVTKLGISKGIKAIQSKDLTKYTNFHTDWNEIHKLKFKVVNDGRFDIRDEKCLKYKGLLNHCLLYKETPYEAFKIIGETIEYLNTIK